MEPSGNIHVAYCRICGKALPPEEQHAALGTVYCSEHVPSEPPPPHGMPPHGTPPPGSPWTMPPSSAPPPQAASTGASPGLAFILGLIPGVGAIYNGQYAKGLVHVVIFGLLISIASADSTGDLSPLFGMLAPVWVFYMAFEAFHTARKRELGQPVEEYSSVVPLRPGGAATGPAILIGIGVIFLLNNLGLLRFSQIFKFWPLILIGFGVHMLMERSGAGNNGEGRRE
jgi:TM2 domain-containing membrane protein YozV